MMASIQRPILAPNLQGTIPIEKYAEAAVNIPINSSIFIGASASVRRSQSPTETDCKQVLSVKKHSYPIKLFKTTALVSKHATFTVYKSAARVCLPVRFAFRSRSHKIVLQLQRWHDER